MTAKIQLNQYKTAEELSAVADQVLAISGELKEAPTRYEPLRLPELDERIGEYAAIHARAELLAAMLSAMSHTEYGDNETVVNLFRSCLESVVSDLLRIWDDVTGIIENADDDCNLTAKGLLAENLWQKTEQIVQRIREPTTKDEQDNRGNSSLSMSRLIEALENIPPEDEDS